jgi:hypothetical protein
MSVRRLQYVKAGVLQLIDCGHAHQWLIVDEEHDRRVFWSFGRHARRTVLICVSS